MIGSNDSGSLALLLKKSVKNIENIFYMKGKWCCRRDYLFEIRFSFNNYFFVNKIKYLMLLFLRFYFIDPCFHFTAENYCWHASLRTFCCENHIKVYLYDFISLIKTETPCSFEYFSLEIWLVSISSKWIRMLKKWIQCLVEFSFSHWKVLT